MKANFLRFLAVVTLSLLVAAQVALPATSTVPTQTRQGEYPIAVENTPTPTPTNIPGGQCGGSTCG